jgi:hypothetical protein
MVPVSLSGAAWEREGFSMADPVDMSTIVSGALPATFTFLYQRLDALLSRRRQDTAKSKPEEAAEIPAELVGELELPLCADQDCVQARLPELRAYALGLERYRRNPGEVTLEDSLLLQTLSDLRSALEDIYGQRFTFQGERRAESGPFSEQHYGKIAGEVTGMEATNAIRGPATSKITADSVERGGKAVGMRARNIGDNR